jgi:hypothetical protein
VKSRRTQAILWFIITVAIVFGVGFYRDAIGDGESVHFSVNYPAKGPAAGGVGAMGEEGYIVVNVAHTGLLKKVVQPNVVNLSTHWLKNVGDEPRKIRLELEGVPYPVRWESTERTWNEEDHSIGRELPPQSNATVDWFITLPKPLPPGDTIVDGAIVVYDAETDEKLTTFPVFVVRNEAGASKASDCCGN